MVQSLLFATAEPMHLFQRPDPAVNYQHPPVEASANVVTLKKNNKKQAIQ
jgi:hypothetical protein